MTEGTRQAALCLHGLCREDRQWLIEQLRTEQQTQLKTLLAELEEIGIPRQFGGATSTVGLKQERDQIESNSKLSNSISYIDAARSEDVYDILEREPRPITYAVIEHYPWRWQDVVRARCQLRDGNINADPTQTEGGALPEKLRQGIIEVFAQRLRNHADQLVGPGASIAEQPARAGVWKWWAKK